MRDYTVNKRAFITGHKKGEKTHGYHKKANKDEYHKEHKFYDDHHKGGHSEKHGDHHEHHGHKAQHHKKGGKHHEGHQHHNKGKNRLKIMICIQFYQFLMKSGAHDLTNKFQSFRAKLSSI